MAVRQVRWQHCFYGDGRWATSVRVKAAGAPLGGRLRIRLPEPATVAGGQERQRIIRESFTGPSGQWHWLRGGDAQQRASYLRPGKVRLKQGREKLFAEGDADGDRFDESQGCYALAARDGRCRCTVVPGCRPLVRPVFRVYGPWAEPPAVSAGGLAVREVVLLADGSALFVVPARLDRPTDVDVSGRVPLAGGPPGAATDFSATVGDP
jgi:hypothetical protein